jgi:hypothetical protein
MNPTNPKDANIEFTFTLAETNMILQALSQRPYVEVANLIHNIQRIAHAKVTPQPSHNDPKLGELGS